MSKYAKEDIEIRQHGCQEVDIMKGADNMTPVLPRIDTVWFRQIMLLFGDHTKIGCHFKRICAKPA